MGIKCEFCQDEVENGLVFDIKTGVYVHLSCLNEAVNDPEDEQAMDLAYLLDPVDEGDYDA